MAYDYALVHLKYTIPLAGLLTLVLKPVLTRQDLYKTLALIAVAFTATLPWDSYLIRTGVWTYPPDAIIGVRLFLIPAEELFFFIIQTYITSLIYVLMSKTTLHAQYLTNRSDTTPGARMARSVGQLILAGCIAIGALLVYHGGRGTYLGLILVWACPFALLTWTFSGYFVVKLPSSSVIAPIVLPTLYLWIVDELALGRGTWAIESGTKLGWCVWGSLEIEEAVFFLATNTLIVFGMVAFDRGMAVLNTFPELFTSEENLLEGPSAVSPLLILKALLMNSDRYDMARVRGIREAVDTLRRKSRSFYLASAVFPGSFRIDLILLYSFCRVADDLVDDSRTEAEALAWINKMTGYLDRVYGFKGSVPKIAAKDDKILAYIDENFPPPTRSAFTLLPAHLLPHEPLYELLEGFKMDLTFNHNDTSKKPTATTSTDNFPIKNEADLELYAHRVASTVGELCLHLSFRHASTRLTAEQEAVLDQAAITMGHALQYVNIARDIGVDAAMGRVYLPLTWLAAEGLTPQDIIANPSTEPKIETLRQKLLDLAFDEYDRSRPVMEVMQRDFRGPMIVAVESYMEIGRVLRERARRLGDGAAVRMQRDPNGRGEGQGQANVGRATVPKSRRLWVAWKTLASQ